MSDTFKGSCFCGEVEIEVTGAPAIMGYCHCEDCRSWQAAPMSAFTLWPPDSVRITKGEENIGTFNKSENAHRKFCTSCGGHLMTDHPGMELVDVYASVLQGFDFQPAMHVHYGNKTVSITDGLPKFNDLPDTAGGSGDMVPE